MTFVPCLATLRQLLTLSYREFSAVPNLPSVMFTILLIACHFDGFASQTLKIDGSTGVKPLIEALVKDYKQDARTLPIDIGKGLKPDLRIPALINGNIDIAMASHGINIQHINALGLKVHLMAKVAVVMGVNQSVDVTSLSPQRLCDIYRGKITDWQQLGGKTLALVPYIRPFDEVDTEVLVEHLACFSRTAVSEEIQVQKKSGHMARALATTPGAIGMTTQVRVAQSHGDIKALAFGGIQPDATNLLTGRYPLTRNLYLITASTPTADVTAFLSFIKSSRGADIIMANNAIPASN